jgi:hypothetical protein
MGFKSVLGKIGKVALKVAPYAAMAIPGVGVPLGMAISGAANAASKKLEGGSWKSSILAGGLGAGGAALGGATGALSKIGPSSSVLSKLGAGAAGKAVGTGTTGKLGAVLGNMGMNALSKSGQGLSDYRDLSGAANAGLSAAMSPNRSGKPSDAYTRGNENQATGGAVPRQPGNAPGFNYGPNNPNFADAILAGQRNAIKNQPFRLYADATDEVPSSSSVSVIHKSTHHTINSVDGGSRHTEMAAYPPLPPEQLNNNRRSLSR